MFSLLKLPNDERTRVYCAMAVAGMMLDIFYKSFPKELGHKDPIPAHEKIKMLGNNAEDLRYLWTALMMLGPTGRPGFKSCTLEVNRYSPFKPSEELNIFGRFRAKSLYHRVFLPVLAGHKLAYADDEADKPFGYQVPDYDPTLRDKVALELCQCLLETYFSFNKTSKTVRFDQARYASTLRDIGSTKLAQAFFILSASSKVQVLDISGMGASTYGVNGCIQIVNLARGMKKIDLSSNELASLGLDGLCEILSRVAPSVNEIDIGNNGLAQFTEQELQRVVTAIPPTVSLITMDFNGLSNELIARLMEFRKSITVFKGQRNVRLIVRPAKMKKKDKNSS